MFQKPVPPAVTDNSVPEPTAQASQRKGVLILIAVILLSAIGVFVLMRRLY
jgi:hypothetical protein